MKQKFKDVPRKKKASVNDFGKAVSPAEVNSMNKRFYDSRPEAAPPTVTRQCPQTISEINSANQAHWEEIRKKRSIPL